MKKIKLIIIITIIVMIIFALFICLNNNTKEKEMTKNIEIIEDESYFSDFEVRDNKVYIYCELAIKNNSDESKNFMLYATMPEDVKGGLLKEAKIYAENKKIYNLQKNKVGYFDVTFIGDFGSVNQKQNRLLPDITIEAVN